MPTHPTTVVFVHGAWAGPESWSNVADLLGDLPVETATVPLPMSALADDVAALDDTLASIEGDVVLVAHAYAGAVVSSTHSPKVTALVYVAALTPDEGETVAEVFNRYEHHPDAPALTPDDEGWIKLPDHAFATAFAQHATPEQQRALAASQWPINPAAITVPVDRPLWHDVASWYLVAEQDRMIPEKTQRYLAERMNARVSAHPVDHLPSVTSPHVVADMIAEAVRETAR